MYNVTTRQIQRNNKERSRFFLPRIVYRISKKRTSYSSRNSNSNISISSSSNSSRSSNISSIRIIYCTSKTRQTAAEESTAAAAAAATSASASAESFTALRKRDKQQQKNPQHRARTSDDRQRAEQTERLRFTADLVGGVVQRLRMQRVECEVPLTVVLKRMKWYSIK